MKRLPIVLFLSILFLNCKTKEEKEEVSVSEEKELTILEKVAYAHGFQKWNTVEEIAFTFNVDREASHFQRSWIWNPKSNDITHITMTDTTAYNRNAMDSIAFKTNAGFINDRYWLLAPFNLIWDKDNFSFDHQAGSLAPISKKPMQKLTIVYGNDGGYTPGDAYDFYFEEDYIIKEWVFRKSNQPEPSMTTTWENYSTIEGLILVKDHKKAEENFNLYIDNISIKKRI